jgi:hypothetical protein
MLGFSTPVWAGPPYVTDDPEPTDTGHWENYAFVSGIHTPGDTGGEAGFDLNYGAATNLQLTLVVPVGYDRGFAGTHWGSGDLEIAAKYRFIQQTRDGWTADVAFFPALGVPTGGRDFGTGHVSLFLPLWAQKDFGPWSTFAGGGYEINPGGGNRDFSLLGWAVTRNFGESVNFGVEIYHQAAASVDNSATTVLALGIIYKLTDHWALLASGGPGLQNTREAGQAAFYLSMQRLD